jgi:hypothetical protein
MDGREWEEIRSKESKSAADTAISVRKTLAGSELSGLDLDEDAACSSSAC